MIATVVIAALAFGLGFYTKKYLSETEKEIRNIIARKPGGIDEHKMFPVNPPLKNCAIMLLKIRSEIIERSRVISGPDGNVTVKRLYPVSES